MATAAKANRAEVGDSYDFLSKIEFFTRSDKIRRGPLNNMMQAMKDMKDIATIIPVDRLVIEGLSQIED